MVILSMLCGMNRGLLLSFLLTLSHVLMAQDTIRTNYPDSKKVWKKVFQNDQKTQDLIYWENGREWMTARYDTADVQYWKWYHENGNPYFEATIIKDELQGLYQVWYENGQLAEVVTFLDNLEDGPASFYYESGQLAAKGNYRQGKMIGDWFFYNENGQAFEGEWKWPFAADPKNLRMAGALKRHKRQGTWRYGTTAGGNNRKVFKEEY